MSYLLARARADQLPLADASVQCVVTSPPYYALREYEDVPPVAWGGDPDHAHEWGDLIPHDSRHRYTAEIAGVQRSYVAAGGVPTGRGQWCACGAWRGQLGLEPDPYLYVEHMVEVFREVWRVLRPDGTVFLNLGDTYASKTRGSDRGWERSRLTNPGRTQKAQAVALRRTGERHRGKAVGIKEKDLIGIPFLVALALRDAGWYWRAPIIWSKRNAMVSPQRDRPTISHEYVWLLSRRTRYYYDDEAIREPFADDRMGRDGARAPSECNRGGRTDGYTKPNGIDPSANGGRTARSVWDISTTPYPDAHFAVFPEELARRCIAAGTRPGDVVLDPFGGTGTVARVAGRMRRDAVSLDLSGVYLGAHALGRVDPLAAAQVAARQEGERQLTIWSEPG